MTASDVVLNLNALKRPVCAALAAGCLFALAGCESMLTRSLYNVAAHVEQTGRYDTDSVEISDYAMLLRVLREQARAGEEQVTLRFSGYEGDTYAAVIDACSELIYDAYGRFVGVYMTPTIDATDTLVPVSIIYRRDRPREEIDALRNVSSFIGLQSNLREILRTFPPYAALELRYGAADDLNPAEMLEEFYFQNPLYAMGMPRVTSEFFKDDRGASTILELRLTFAGNAEELIRQQAAVRVRFGELAARADPELPPPELALQLFDIVRAYIEYDREEAFRAAGTETDRLARPYSMAGAMLDRKAVGEGYALAYKALCDEFLIPCEVVSGHLGGYAHAWNVLQLDGDWYMLDAAIAGEDGRYGRFLGTDEQWLDARYTWDAARYPKCGSDNLTYESIVTGQTEPEPDGEAEPDEPPAPEPGP